MLVLIGCKWLVGLGETHGEPVWSYYCKRCLSFSCLMSKRCPKETTDELMGRWLYGDLHAFELEARVF
jgi:hypothetical protein